MRFKTKLKKINSRQSEWKTDASLLSAGMMLAAKFPPGPKVSFGNGVGNTGLLEPLRFFRLVSPDIVPQLVATLR
jgi:hypothetical protein